MKKEFPYVKNIWETYIWVVYQVHQFIISFFESSVTTQQNNRMSPLCQDYVNIQDLLDVFDLYTPKHISGGDGDR